MTPAFNSNHANAIKAYATDHAVANGMGRGEYAAAFANLRGLSVVIVPQLYARLFAGATVRRSVEHSHHHFRNCMLGLCSAPSAFCGLIWRLQDRGQAPTKVWLAVALLGGVLPELLHQSLSDKDLALPKPEGEADSKAN